MHLTYSNLQIEIYTDLLSPDHRDSVLATCPEFNSYDMQDRDDPNKRRKASLWEQQMAQMLLLLESGVLQSVCELHACFACC